MRATSLLASMAFVLAVPLTALAASDSQGSDVGTTIGNTAQQAGNAVGNATHKAGQQVSDGWITTQIQSELATDSVVKGSDIRVETDHHVVTLSGTITSEPARKRALSIANQTQGVAGVTDNLQLGQP